MLHCNQKVFFFKPETHYLNAREDTMIELQASPESYFLSEKAIEYCIAISKCQNMACFLTSGITAVVLAGCCEH